MKAIVSVSDKTGLGELALGLVGLGVELYATGNTRRQLDGSRLAAQPVEALTGFPEMLDGRVKTLHPAVHGGILARRDRPDHLAQLAEHGLSPIDMVVGQPLPLPRDDRPARRDLAEALEQIDIGGPTPAAGGGQELPRRARPVRPGRLRAGAGRVAARRRGVAGHAAAAGGEGVPACGRL